MLFSCTCIFLISLTELFPQLGIFSVLCCKILHSFLTALCPKRLAFWATSIEFQLLSFLFSSCSSESSLGGERREGGE